MNSNRTQTLAVAEPGSKVSPDDARELAKEAWLFGLPLVMFEKQVDFITYIHPGRKSRG